MMARGLAVFLSLLGSYSLQAEQKRHEDIHLSETSNKSSPVRTPLNEFSIPGAAKKLINLNLELDSQDLINPSKHPRLGSLQEGKAIQSGIHDATLNDNSEVKYLETTVLGLALFFDRLQVTLMTSEEKMQECSQSRALLLRHGLMVACQDVSRPLVTSLREDALTLLPIQFFRPSSGKVWLEEMLELLRVVSSYIVVVKFEPADESVVNDPSKMGDEINKGNEREGGKRKSGNYQSMENTMEKKAALAYKNSIAKLSKKGSEKESISKETAQLESRDEMLEMNTSLIYKNGVRPEADVATDYSTLAKASSPSRNLSIEEIPSPTGKKSTPRINVNFLKQSVSGPTVLNKKILGSATESLPDVTGEHHYFLAEYSGQFVRVREVWAVARGLPLVEWVGYWPHTDPPVMWSSKNIQNRPIRNQGEGILDIRRKRRAENSMEASDSEVFDISKMFEGRGKLDKKSPSYRPGELSQSLLEAFHLDIQSTEANKQIPVENEGSLDEEDKSQKSDLDAEVLTKAKPVETQDESSSAKKFSAAHVNTKSALSASFKISYNEEVVDRSVKLPGYLEDILSRHSLIASETSSEIKRNENLVKLRSIQTEDLASVSKFSGNSAINTNYIKEKTENIIGTEKLLGGINKMDSLESHFNPEPDPLRTVSYKTSKVGKHKITINDINNNNDASPMVSTDGPYLRRYSNSIAPTDFRGNVIRVAIMENPPLVFSTVGARGEVRQVAGYLPDLWTLLEQELNFSTSWTRPADGQYGAEYPGGGWSGVVGALANNSADVAMAGLGLTLSRQRVMDASFAILRDTAGLLVSSTRPFRFNWDTYAIAFTREVWLCITFVWLLVGAALYIVYYKDDETSFTTIIFTLFGAFAQQGCETVHPSLGGRLVHVSVWMCALVVYASYLSRFTTFLTVKAPPADISSLHAAVKSGYQITLVEGTLLHNFVIKSPSFTTLLKENPPKMVGTLKQGLAVVKEGKGALLFDTVPLLFSSRSNCSLLHHSYESFSDAQYLGFRKNSPYSKSLDAVLRKAAMTGVLHRVWEQWEHMGTLDSDLDPSKAPRAKKPSSKAPSSKESINKALIVKEPSSETPGSKDPSTVEKPSRSKPVPGSDVKGQNLDAGDNDAEGKNIANNERVNNDFFENIDRSIQKKSGYDSLGVINVGEDGLSMSSYVDSIAAIASSVKQGDDKPTNTNSNSSGKRNKNTKQQVDNDEKTRHFGDILDNVGFTRDCKVIAESVIEPLGLDKTIGAFGVLALGVTVSAVVLVLEFWVVLGCCGRIRGWCCGPKNNQNNRFNTKSDRKQNRNLQRLAWDRSLKSEEKFCVGTFDHPNLMTIEGKITRKSRKTTPGTQIFVTGWEDKLQL